MTPSQASDSSRSQNRTRVTAAKPATKPRAVEFNTAWVRIDISADDAKPHRLVLRESGRSIVIGQFLSEPERTELAAELRRKIAEMGKFQPDDQRPASQTFDIS